MENKTFYIDKVIDNLIIKEETSLILLKRCKIKYLDIILKKPFELSIVNCKIKEVNILSFNRIENFFIVDSNIEYIYIPRSISSYFDVNFLNAITIDNSKLPDEILNSFERSKTVRIINFKNLDKRFSGYYNIHYLDNLSCLFLNNIKDFIEVKKEFFMLENLEYLDISNNNIDFIEEGSFDHLKKLIFIDISNNNLNNIKNNIFVKNKKLFKVDLSKNYFVDDFIYVNSYTEVIGINKKVYPIKVKELKSFKIENKEDKKCLICFNEENVNLLLSNLEDKEIHDCEVIICESCLNDSILNDNKCLFCKQKITDNYLLKI